MKTYSTRHVAAIFNTSRETVRVWSREFAEFLSDRATPDKGERRVFSEDDMKVFALIKQRRDDGHGFVDILDDLGQGQRGEIPSQLPMAYVPPSDQLVALQNQVTTLEARAKQAEDSLMASEGENRLLKEQLKDAHEEIKRLNREIGRLETRL